MALTFGAGSAYAGFAEFALLSLFGAFRYLERRSARLQSR
jgi:hypothetical protein